MTTPPTSEDGAGLIAIRRNEQLTGQKSEPYDGRIESLVHLGAMIAELIDDELEKLDSTPTPN